MLKKLLIALFITGAVFVTAGLVMTGGDFTKIGAAFSRDEDYTLVEKVGEQPFSNLKVSLKNANIEVYPHEDENYKIAYYNSEYDTKEVLVENNQLKIVQNYNYNQWFNFKFTSKKVMTIKLYMPSTFDGETDIHTNSGDIALNNLLVKNLNVVVSSGDITLNKINVEEDINLAASSGEIEAQDINAKQLFVSSNSGEVEIENALVSSLIEVESVSGDIELQETSTEEVRLSANSGRILLNQVNANKYEVETTSGNIRMNLSGNIADFKMAAEVNSGTIYLNDQKVGKSLTSLNGSKTLTADANSGNIYINIR